MRVIRGLDSVKPFVGGCVLTVGNFDGVHSGHKAVLQELCRRGGELGVPVVVVLFEPQPLEFFAKNNAPTRLLGWRDKAVQLAKLGVDYLVLAKFNARLANYAAEDFVADFLCDKLQVRELVVGDDFHFGKGRCGNFQTLVEQGNRCGFGVSKTTPHIQQGSRVSSTLIRDALHSGDLHGAKLLLGRDYCLSGKVTHGNKRGTAIGFPTANIAVQKNPPLTGVYAVMIAGLGDKKIGGVANVGVRPTVAGCDKPIMEVHIFADIRQIYRQRLSVHFQHKIRDERRFDSIDSLKKQIQQDVIVAKQLLSHH